MQNSFNQLLFYLSYVLFYLSYMLFYLSYMLFYLSYMLFYLSYMLFYLSYMLFYLSYMLFYLSYVILLEIYVILLELYVILLEIYLCYFLYKTSLRDTIDVRYFICCLFQTFDFSNKMSGPLPVRNSGRQLYHVFLRIAIVPVCLSRICLFASLLEMSCEMTRCHHSKGSFT